jgi:hypothetical protein
MIQKDRTQRGTSTNSIRLLEGDDMKIYRPLSLILAAIFASTGLLFLVVPDRVVLLFNTLSTSFGMPQSPAAGHSLYLILACGYMYVVTVLACLMFIHPSNRTFPLLMAHAKLASSVLSLILFVFHANYLIFLSNFIIDGFIGGIAVVFYFRMGKELAWASS